MAGGVVPPVVPGSINGGLSKREKELSTSLVTAYFKDSEGNVVGLWQKAARD